MVKSKSNVSFFFYNAIIIVSSVIVCSFKCYCMLIFRLPFLNLARGKKYKLANGANSGLFTVFYSRLMNTILINTNLKKQKFCNKP